jgi:hypothetical protein
MRGSDSPDSDIRAVSSPRSRSSRHLVNPSQWLLSRELREQPRFADVAMQSHGRALDPLRSILISIYGLTRDSEHAQCFDTHSPRHFLPEFALERGLSVEDRCASGRWSASSLQDSHLLRVPQDVMPWSGDSVTLTCRTSTRQRRRWREY